MQKTEGLVLADVSPASAYRKLRFRGAVSIPMADLSQEEEDALFLALPEGRPVLVNCRKGATAPGAYERIKELRPDIPQIGYIDDVPLFDEYNAWLLTQNTQTLLGAITAEEALEYLKSVPDLAVIDVDDADPEGRVLLDGAIRIPLSKLESFHGFIPDLRPVLLVSSDGKAAAEAYLFLQTLRPDCSSLCYLDGEPPVEEYNQKAE